MDTNIDMFYLSVPGWATKAAIEASKALSLELITSLSDPNCTTCLMETSDKKHLLFHYIVTAQKKLLITLCMFE